MKKSILLSLLILSIVAIADSENGSNGAVNHMKNKPSQKFCLFHEKIYEVLSFSEGECSYIVPGRNKTLDHGFGVPHDPACFSEFIRMRR